MRDRSGLWTVLGTVVALSLLSAAAGCTPDRPSERPDVASTEPPMRVVCSEGGKVVLDDYVADDDRLSAGYGYMSFVSQTLKTPIHATSNCVARRVVKPADWKPVFPG